MNTEASGKSKRTWDVLSDEQRRKAIAEIIDYFQTERNEEIGVIAAENVLDFFLQNFGNMVYNKALDDMRPFLEKEFDGTLINMDVSLRRKD